MAQSNDASTDKGGLAPHKNLCPHVGDAIDIPSNLEVKLQIISSQNGNNGQVTCSSHNCDKGECWLCLKCHEIFCGRYGNQHMISHYISSNTTHCMAMGVNDLSFWCYKCENYINHLSVQKVWNFYSIAHIAKFNDVIPPALLEKTTFHKQPSTTVTLQAIDESEDDDDDDKDNKDNDDNDDVLDDDEKQQTQQPSMLNADNNVTIGIIDDLLCKFSLEAPVIEYRKTALFYHKDCLLHEPGNNDHHVEQPKRCSVSYQMLADYGLLKDLIEIKPREATKQELKLTHSSNHVEVIICNKKKYGWYDSDTFYNKHTSRAAKLAAGAIIDLMCGILENKYHNGFALVRPPGHHCEHNKPMGFCLFNNAVVAVNCIRNKGLCKKVLIVDFDVHHGNGTQNMFYDDKDILYFSVHRHDHGFFYPSTGKAGESGEGFNVNVPLNVETDQGHGDKEYVLIWRDILIPICGEFKPEIILISAGFDACIGDPLGGMRITPPCYGLLTRLLLNECANIAIVLEGGYNLETMPRAICCCNYALLKGAVKQKDQYDVNEFYDEFKENIINDQQFHEWYKQYGDELVDVDYTEWLNKYNPNVANAEDFSNMGSCKKTIKEVLEEQQKYWKCAAQILKKYNNV